MNRERQLRIVVTGATGMVGEGVLLTCLEDPFVEQVLMVNRKHSAIAHPKLQELIVPDFTKLDSFSNELSGYDACIYCAGISSRGMSEANYTRVIFDVTLGFARTLGELNPGLRFCYVSGNLTDSSEHGKLMWARVKGKTENALLKLPELDVYNFRPGFMRPLPSQKNVKSYYRAIGTIYPLLHGLFPNLVSTMHDVGIAMLRTVQEGYPKRILEIPDINSLAQGG